MILNLHNPEIIKFKTHPLTEAFQVCPLLTFHNIYFDYTRQAFFAIFHYLIIAACQHVETLPQKIVIWELTLDTLKQEINKMYIHPNPNPIALEVAKQVQLHIEGKIKTIKSHQQKLDRKAI